MNKICIISLFLAASFSSHSLFCQENIPAPPPPAKPAESIDDIENKIIISLFFRGEVADVLMEAGFSDKILGESFPGYAKNREALIIWAEKNPKEAAELYLYSKGKKGKLRKRKYQIAQWELNPHFRKLIKNLNEAAGDLSLSDEDLNLASRRLFEGAHADVNYVRASSEEGEKTKTAPEINFADFNVNPKVIGAEVSKLSFWAKGLDKNFKFLKEKQNPGIKKLYSACQSSYKKFIKLALSLKTNKKINEVQAALLEKSRINARRNFMLLDIRLLSAKAKIFLKTIEKNGGGDFVLSAEKALKNAARNADILRKGDINLKKIRKAGKQAYMPIFYIMNASRVYAYLINLKFKAENIGFSCLYDYILFKYLVYYNPSSSYAVVRSDIDKGIKEISAILGDYSERNIFEKKKKIADFVSNLEKNIQKAKIISKFNANMQNIFWNIIFNPFNISIKKGKIKAEINYL